MSRPFEKIIFTGDFLRPAADGMRPHQHENIDWLAKVLRQPVGMATGLPCETVHWDDNWINGTKFDTAAIEAIYGTFWQQPGIRAWAQVFAAETLPAVVEDLFAHLFARSLVIGFELPPYLAYFCERHDIPFIDCAISPVRFMDDLVLRISASTLDMTAALRAYRVPEALIQLTAGVLSSNVAKSNPHPPRPNSLLLVLQTCFDKVVIEDGRFVSVLDHLDRLHEVAQNYDSVMIREHPLEAQPEVLGLLLDTLPGSSVTTENFYRLVSHDNLRGVAALSSSCLSEARYFGKVGHSLIPGFTIDSLTPGIEGVNIDDTVITPDFWRDLLGAAGCTVSAKDGLRLPPKPNRFRQQLRSGWGYNQIDTDITFGWAQRSQ